MAVLQILKMGHPILRKKASKVKDFDTIHDLISNMKDTLTFIGASGLAAPQVMVSKRVIVYRVNQNRIPKNAKLNSKPWTYMINPEIIPITKKKTLFWERCLSLPGLHAKVPRYDKIHVKYFTPDKQLVEHYAHSTWAALIQHEYDHLDGILYPLRMKDFSYFGYNDTPGDIARDIKKNKYSIDPLFLDLVKKWPYKNTN
ncbi:MAG: peptide deformylase [Rickettsiales bacterium]|nr:peptide deformylase [Rickettsiales bacterium]OUV79607.1 MAG: hypothetical protein CBC91_03450 [Rickettsiales bacterium TMED131]